MHVSLQGAGYVDNLMINIERIQSLIERNLTK